MTTNLSIPFYLNNNPVIRLSDTIGNGVIVNKDNVLTGEQISYDSKYLKIQDHAKPASFVYIDGENSFGSFAFPEKQEGDESFILTSTTNQDGTGYIWKNILDLPLTKYLTVDFTIINSNESKIQINNIDSNNMPILFWDSNNYNYVGIFDLYITLDTIAVSNLLKNNKGICLLSSKPNATTTQININDMLDITNTVNNHFHKVKVINNIISPNIDDNGIITLNYYYYLIENYNGIDFSEDNKIINITGPTASDDIELKIKGTLTIFEFKK
ncbi:MAG: hypothetical protein IJ997_01640 [Mycoplasmataceae bacterium]|nr:hypothetical protein [Mycoplasmataceae bacterium]